MKIIAIEKENTEASAAHFKLLGEEEARAVWDLQQTGFIREIYFRNDENSAVLILESSSTENAKEQLERLPFVENKLIHFELIPLKAYSGFARLFK